MKAEIITIGDELLIGQVVDTNSAWMAERLNEVGIELYQITSVHDNREHILLWCEVSGVRYYLYVDSNKQLGMTTQKTSAASWTVSGGRISTAVRTSNRNSKTTTYYLGVSGSSFDVSTRKSSLVLYEQNT